MNEKVDVKSAIKLLDLRINEAATQLVGHCDAKYDSPFLRFVLLCSARAEFENGVEEPELQWTQVARDAYVFASECKPHKKDHQPLPRLLSDTPSGAGSQREYYGLMASNLVIENTDDSPAVHSGTDFALRVAIGEIQIRYA